MDDARDIAAILLAAGQSRRFGADDKLLAPMAGEPLALHAARRIVELGLRRRIAVCADADGALARELTTLGFDVAVNPHPENGLSSSLARGIEEVERGPADAALLCLADMPFVGIDHLRHLLARFNAAHAPVVASTDGLVSTPPALFARSKFAQLSASKGDRGGKALLADAVLVRANAGELADVDRPADLARPRLSTPPS